MPWIGDAPSNGLKLSVRVSSGEDSMTSAGAFEVLPLAVLEPVPAVLGVVLLDEEQAARPAPRSMTAPAATALLLRILLVVNFDLSSRVVRISRRSCVSLVRRRCPSKTGQRRPVASTPPPGWASAAGERGSPACIYRWQADTGC